MIVFFYTGLTKHYTLDHPDFADCKSMYSTHNANRPLKCPMISRYLNNINILSLFCRCPQPDHSSCDRVQWFHQISGQWNVEGTLAVELLLFQSFAKFFWQKMTVTNYIFFCFFQENLHKLIELQRDLVGIDTLVHKDRVCFDWFLSPMISVLNTGTLYCTDAEVNKMAHGHYLLIMFYL